MKFKYRGTEYELTFQRKYKNVDVFRKANAEDKAELKPHLDAIKAIVKTAVQVTFRVKTTERSQYPFTYVKLYELHEGKEPVVLASTHVGCVPTDQFSNASGRLYALKELSYKLRKNGASDGLIAAVWETYNNRGKVNKVAKEAVTTVAKVPEDNTTLPIGE